MIQSKLGTERNFYGRLSSKPKVSDVNQVILICNLNTKFLSFKSRTVLLFY